MNLHAIGFMEPRGFREREFLPVAAGCIDHVVGIPSWGTLLVGGRILLHLSLHCLYFAGDKISKGSTFPVRRRTGHVTGTEFAVLQFRNLVGTLITDAFCHAVHNGMKVCCGGCGLCCPNILDEKIKAVVAVA